MSNLRYYEIFEYRVDCVVLKEVYTDIKIHVSMSTVEFLLKYGKNVGINGQIV